MVRRANAMERQIRENLRGGNGSVEFVHIVKQNELGGKCRLFAKMIVNPGCSVGLHDHTNEEEIYYILAGSGMVVDNGLKQEVGPGDAIVTGGGNSHSIENTGKEPLEVMAVILLY